MCVDTDGLPVGAARQAAARREVRPGSRSGNAGLVPEEAVVLGIAAYSAGHALGGGWSGDSGDTPFGMGD